MQSLQRWLDDLLLFDQQDRPLVTLSYAQSLEGSFAVGRGRPTRISGTKAMQLTHTIRAHHDAILVGIGTILSDDPQLTVRLSLGGNPRAIVLDSHLRIPLNCKLLQREDHRMIIFTGKNADPVKREALEKRGVIVLEGETMPGQPLNLGEVLKALRERGVQKLMVEGGAEVITGFLKERLVDRAVVTLAPLWLGGLAGVAQALFRTDDEGSLRTPAILQPSIEVLDDNFILYGWVGETQL